jgi:hypothetical protein
MDIGIAGAGIGLPMHEAFKHSGDLLQWVDTPDQDPL